MPLLQRHVIQPMRAGKVQRNWTSNNSESLNHVLKTATNWKLCDLPKFIEIWQTLVEGESKERECAIRDQGDFKLAPTHTHNLVDISRWASLSADQQMKRLKRFQGDKGKTNPNEIVSNNGQRAVVKTPSGGKKIGQLKRPRAERSRTPSEVSKDATVGQLYRYLSLHTFSTEQQSLLDLSLAMDKRGKSRGIAFIWVPCMLVDHVLDHEGEVFKGKKLHFSEEKRKHASLLKKGRWVRNYKTSTRATVCLNQLPLHRECYQEKEKELKGFTEPMFDVGARLYHQKFEDDLDTVLAKAHSFGLREINLPCSSIALCDEAIKFVDRYKGKFDIYFSAGVGPWFCNVWGPTAEARLKTFYQMESCSSAGIIGLDFRSGMLKKYPKDVQLKVFEAQVKLACKYGKSLMLLERKAHKVMVKVLECYKSYLPPCAMWGYATDRQSQIKIYVELGCYIVVSANSDNQFNIIGGVTKVLEKGILPTAKILLGSNCPAPSSEALPRTVKLTKSGHLHRNIYAERLIHRNIKMLKFKNEFRRVPQCVFVTRDLVANALDIPVDDCDDLTRELYDNTLKFFKICKNKSEQKPRALVTQTVCSVFESIRRFFTELTKDLWPQDVVVVITFLVTFIVSLVVIKCLDGSSAPVKKEGTTYFTYYYHSRQCQ